MCECRHVASLDSGGCRSLHLYVWCISNVLDLGRDKGLYLPFELNLEPALYRSPYGIKFTSPRIQPTFFRWGKIVEYFKRGASRGTPTPSTVLTACRKIYTSSSLGLRGTRCSFLKSSI